MFIISINTTLIKSKKKILIKNGVIVNYDSRAKKDILINNGIILNIADSIDIHENDELEIIDAGGNYIFPGFIDAHTHPGLPEDLGFPKNTDDFQTETKAALMGGTTTIVDFAEQAKGERLIDALNKRKGRYKNASGAKYTFHIAVTDVKDDLMEQLKEVKECGINSVKIYTTYGNMLTNQKIMKVMDCCAKLDMVLLVHCEEDTIIKYCSGRKYYDETRPYEAEQNMVNTVINFARLTGCKAYICHVSSKESAKIIDEAKRKGQEIYFETCPQYMIFDNSKYRLNAEETTKYLLSPPFRTFEDNRALIGAALSGSVDLISTDHCAFLFEKHKKRFADDITKAAKGIPGIQLRASIMYDLLVLKNHMRLEDFVKLLSYNPSRILKLEDRGYIREGMASDIVVWCEERFIVSKDLLYEGTDYTPYEGISLTGKPLYVII